MNNWQRLLKKGNEHYYQENWQQAENYYKAAESLLDKAWCQDTENIEILMAWIGTHHNLAALFEKQGAHQTSLSFLVMPYKRLLSLFAEHHASNKIKVAAIEALKITLEPIELFKKKYPICKTCMEKLLSEERPSTTYNTVLH